MLGLLVTLLVVALALNAAVRSVVARFWFGLIAGIVRIALVALEIVLSARVLAVGEQGPSAALAFASASVALSGPIVSMSTIFAVYRHKANVAAESDDVVTRLLMAWLPVAILDAARLFLALMAHLLTRDL